MQHQIKDNIDRAINENNIKKLRIYLNDLQHWLINNDDDLEYFSNYLIDSLIILS